MSLKKYEQGSISGKVIIPHFTVSAYMLTLSSLQSYLLPVANFLQNGGKISRHFGRPNGSDTEVRHST